MHQVGKNNELRGKYTSNHRFSLAKITGTDDEGNIIKDITLTITGKI